LTGFFFWGGKMTGFLGRFWALIPFEIDFCHKESKFCRVCPKGGYKNFLWSRRFWFWSRGRVRICFVPKTSRFFNVSDKNSTFFAVSDKNSRSEGQNKFLPSRGTKIKTWVTTRNFCTLLRDKSNKILILNDKIWFQKISRPKKRPKNPVILPPQQKKACQKHRKCFVLVSQVFLLCELVFLYIAGENMIFSSFLLSVGSQILIFWFWRFYFEKFEVKFHEKFGYREKVCNPSEKKSDPNKIRAYL